MVDPLPGSKAVYKYTVGIFIPDAASCFLVIASLLRRMATCYSINSLCYCEYNRLLWLPCRQTYTSQSLVHYFTKQDQVFATCITGCKSSVTIAANQLTAFADHILSEADRLFPLSVMLPLLIAKQSPQHACLPRLHNRLPELQTRKRQLQIIQPSLQTSLRALPTCFTCWHAWQPQIQTYNYRKPTYIRGSQTYTGSISIYNTFNQPYKESNSIYNGCKQHYNGGFSPYTGPTSHCPAILPFSQWTILHY